MIKTILVPTDGSVHATKAVELAADVAAKYDATLVLLHVLLSGPLPEPLRHMAEVEHLVEPEAPAAPPAANLPRGIGGTLSEQGYRDLPAKVYTYLAERILSEAEALAKGHGVGTVRTATEGGEPARQILHYASHEGADMIVMGSRGLSDLKGLVTGSVSHKVSHLAECTVVTVK